MSRGQLMPVANLCRVAVYWLLYDSHVNEILAQNLATNPRSHYLHTKSASYVINL